MSLPLHVYNRSPVELLEFLEAFVGTEFLRTAVAEQMQAAAELRGELESAEQQLGEASASSEGMRIVWQMCKSSRPSAFDSKARR